jgi:beta-N-acetylhexosaminidase
MKNADKMTLEEKIGQVITLGGAIGGLGDEKGLKEALAMVRSGRASGFYLGYPRFKNPGQALELTAKLQAAAETPLFMCTDMETGLGYVIIEGSERHPYLMALGAARDEELARELGAIVGREARAIGFNWNYGPSVDVNSFSRNPIIGIRALSDNPDLAGRLGAAYITGCEAERVICSAKHFPGHGALAQDTHDQIGAADADRRTLMARDVAPFRKAIEAGVRSVMSTHIIFPAFGDERFPATMSRNIMTDLLRGELGFEGLAVSDSLAMKAISENYGKEEAVIQSFLAGCDVVIVPADWNPFDALSDAVRSGRIGQARLDEAVERILQTKKWLYPDGYKAPDFERSMEVFATPETKTAIDACARNAVTVLEEKSLPLKAVPGKRLYLLQERQDAYQFFPWERKILDFIEAEVKKREPAALVKRISRKCSYKEAKQIKQLAESTDELIFFCIVKNYASDPCKGRLSPQTNEFLRDISYAMPLTVVSLGSPYVIEGLCNLSGFICTYGECTACASAALDVLFGKQKPRGKLPVAISEKYPFGAGKSL